MTTAEAIEKIVDEANARLMEHCDSVRIFTTYKDSDGSHAFTRGQGQFYASLGSIREWVDAADESNRQNVRARED